MLKQPERPIKEVISPKFKIFHLTGHLSINLLFYLLILLLAKPEVDVPPANHLAILTLFVLVFLTDTNSWNILYYNLNNKLKVALSIINMSVYLSLVIMLRNSLMALLLLGISAALLDLLDFKNAFFVWRNQIIAVFAAIAFIFFSTTPGGHSLIQKLTLLLLPIMQFLLIYVYEMARYSDKLITQEIEKRQTTFFSNQISQLEVKQKAAYYDPMTHILNRRGFELEVVPLFQECKRDNTPFALLALDIDHFKRVNDTYGHDVGDIALKAFVDCINSTIRPATDAIVRIGGEEFIVTTIGVDNEEKLMAFAERVRKIVEVTVWDNDKRFTVSIGAALFPNTTAETVEELQKKADLALYEAKETGRNKVVIYRDEDNPASLPS